jgi:hypothetical protein
MIKLGANLDGRFEEHPFDMVEVVANPTPPEQGGFKPGSRFFLKEWEFMKRNHGVDIGMVVQHTKTGEIERVKGQLQLC